MADLHQFGHDFPKIVFAWLGSFLRQSRQRIVGHVQKRQEIGFLFIDINQAGQKLVRFLALPQVLKASDLLVGS